MKFHIKIVDASVNTYILRYKMLLIIHVVYMISANIICSTIMCPQLSDLNVFIMHHVSRKLVLNINLIWIS